MTIISIKNYKSNVVKLLLDDNTSYLVSLDSLVKFDLYTGKELSLDDLIQISRYELKRVYIAKAIELITIRPRSKKELELYLIKKLKDQTDVNSLIAEIISYLEQKNYLNDELFVKWWINNRNSNKPKSKQELRYELLKKGISKTTIEEVLQAALSITDEANHIREALNKKFKVDTITGLDIKEQQKVISYFLRKGYNYELIRSVIYN